MRGNEREKNRDACSQERRRAYWLSIAVEWWNYAQVSLHLTVVPLSCSCSRPAAEPVEPQRVVVLDAQRSH